jgi:hypothetical protein
MYKLEFTLKQHTPLIHFQYDQVGATLRATEVKPKLDQFIIEKLLLEQGIEFDFYELQNDGKQKFINAREAFKRETNDPKTETQKKWASWLVGKGKNEHVALDYKLGFSISGKHFEESIPYTQTPDKKWRPNFPCIFGNVDSEEKWKHVMYCELTKAIAISLRKDLIEELKLAIPGFFFKSNFGFRQSKGFGSFYLDKNDKLYISPSAQYHFSVRSNSQLNELADSKDVFQAIDLFNKSLRSGINTSNYGGIYFKSMMFLYAKSLNHQWDKKTLREYFYSQHELYREVKRNRILDTDGTVYFNAPKKEDLLFRDLLGLSSDQDWMGYGNPKKDKDGRIVLKNGKNVYKSDTIEKKSINDEIQRFQSPITFKPIQRDNQQTFDIYLIVNPIPAKYLGQEMNIVSKSYGTSKKMSIPSSFDIASFLNFCFKTAFPSNKEFQNHVSGSKSFDAQKLERIYSELRNC